MYVKTALTVNLIEVKLFQAFGIIYVKWLFPAFQIFPL